MCNAIWMTLVLFLTTLDRLVSFQPVLTTPHTPPVPLEQLVKRGAPAAVPVTASIELKMLLDDGTEIKDFGFRESDVRQKAQFIFPADDGEAATTPPPAAPETAAATAAEAETEEEAPTTIPPGINSFLWVMRGLADEAARSSNINDGSYGNDDDDNNDGTTEDAEYAGGDDEDEEYGSGAATAGDDETNQTDGEETEYPDDGGGEEEAEEEA